MATRSTRHVLIVEKDMEAAEALTRLSEALGLPVELAQTHKNAIRACATHPVGIIFMNPDINMIDSRTLVEDIQSLPASRKNSSAPPILFLVESLEILSKLGLKGHAGTGVLIKPLQLEQVYVALHKLGLINLEAPPPAETSAGKIKAWQEFLTSAEQWMAKLRDQMVPK